MIVKMFVVCRFNSSTDHTNQTSNFRNLSRAHVAVLIYPMHVLNMLICLFKHYLIGRHNNNEHIALISL